MRLSALQKRELERYFKIYSFDNVFKNSTFLITGSKGLVGTALIQWLLYENEINHSNISIIASTRTPDSFHDFVESTDNIEYCMFGEEERFTKDRKIDFIVHAAAEPNNSYHLIKPINTLDVIVNATEKILKIADNKKSNVVYLSSEAVYGHVDLDFPIHEDYFGAINSLDLKNTYALGKAIAEMYCKAYASERKLNIKILRPAVIQGLYQSYDMYPINAEILRCLVESRDIIFKSNGETKKCIVYSLDVVSAILFLLEKGVSGEAYNVTNPDTYMSVKEWAQICIDSINPKIKAVFSNSSDSNRRRVIQSIAKLKNLGWSPQTDFLHMFKVDYERFK